MVLVVCCYVDMLSAENREQIGFWWYAVMLVCLGQRTESKEVMVACCYVVMLSAENREQNVLHIYCYDIIPFGNNRE